VARLKLPGRLLEAPGNRGPRGMIITGATRDRTRLTACSAGFFGATATKVAVVFLGELFNYLLNKSPSGDVAC
jgi:hypothetical protein